jgi:6-phosphofructokinase 1
MNKEVKTIGILCSGGDSPGMNAAIRAATRTALFHGHRMIGIKRGYSGLLNHEFQELTLSSVGNILQRGGTFLQTSRCPEFLEKSARRQAADNLIKQSISSLIVIGGDGSFNGAHLLSTETKTPVIGIPGTIDNDISGTQYTIGYDTAVRNAIEAVDRIRDTASSHARTFLIEVMGRNSSAIAQKVGLCTGAENIILPHEEINCKSLVDDIKRGVARGKTSSIIIVAEGPVSGRSYQIQKELKQSYDLAAHVCILGHIQRGGSPTGFDRLMACHMGNLAVNAIIEGKDSLVTTYNQGRVSLTELEKCLQKTNKVNEFYTELANTLSI